LVAIINFKAIFGKPIVVSQDLLYIWVHKLFWSP